MNIKKIAVCFILILLAGCSKTQITGNAVKETIPVELNKEMEIYFCPQDNCEWILINALNSSAASIHCAFFDIDLKNLTMLIGEKSSYVDVKLVVDNENYGAIKGAGVRQDTSQQYSHNKFCVIDDEIVTTGSMNPSFTDAYRNNNNLLVIHSKYLAENYEDEFRELWNREFGKGEKVKYPIIYLNNHEIENYFCPEDSCVEHIVAQIKKAEQSIYFMAFSFTSTPIADAILFNDKADIKGIFDKRDAGSKYSQYTRLKDFGLDIALDKNKYTLHHKVFIIDNRTVITGSMNPTGSGNSKNDENILIIHDKEIAQKYVDEFWRLY